MFNGRNLNVIEHTFLEHTFLEHVFSSWQLSKQNIELPYNKITTFSCTWSIKWFGYTPSFKRTNHTSLSFQFIVIMSGITYAPAYYDKYEGRYSFPSFAEGLGWLMVVSPLALIVGGAIVQSIRYGGVSSSFHHSLCTSLFLFFFFY